MQRWLGDTSSDTLHPRSSPLRLMCGTRHDQCTARNLGHKGTRLSENVIANGSLFGVVVGQFLCRVGTVGVSVLVGSSVEASARTRRHLRARLTIGALGR